MKLKVSKELLKSAVDKVFMPIQSSPLKIELSFIEIECYGNKLLFTGSDGHVFVRATVEVEAPDCPAFCVDGLKLKNATSGIVGVSEDPEISMELKEAKLILKLGKSRQSIPVFPSEAFPNYPVPDINEQVTEIPWTEEKSNHVINCSKVCAKHNILTGMSTIMVDKDNIVGTDGYRLLAYDIESAFKDTQKILIPFSLVQYIKLFKNGVMAISEQRVELYNEHLKISGELYNSDYPNWKPVIPTSFSHKVAFNKREALKSLSVVELTANKENNFVLILDIYADRVRFYAEDVMSNTKSETDIDAKVEFQSGLETKELISTRAFNINYFKDLLSIVSEEEVVLSFNLTYKTPFYFKMDKTQSILMPVTLNIAKKLEGLENEPK